MDPRRRLPTTIPVSTINQQWNGVLKTEYAQIIKLRPSVVTTATPKAQKALQVKEAQYSSLSEASTALKSDFYTYFIHLNPIYTDFKKGDRSTSNRVWRVKK